MRAFGSAHALPAYESALTVSRLELIVPHPMRGNVGDRVGIELIEADVDIGFALVDEAKAYRALGQPEFSCRALHDAEDIVEDIERRLRRLCDSESLPFHPLVAELLNEIAAGMKPETS